MEIFSVLFVMYLVKIWAEDTYHGVKGTPNPRAVARARRQRSRSKSRTWGALATYWGDLVEDASQAATDNRRRKAEKKRKERERQEHPTQDAEWYETPGEPEATSPVSDPIEDDTDVDVPLDDPQPPPDPKPEADPKSEADEEPQQEGTSEPAAAPTKSNVYPFPNRTTNNSEEKSDMSTEVLGLDQSIEYARKMAGWANGHGSAGNEGYIAHLESSNVSGEALASAHEMQQAFAAAAAAAEHHAEQLEGQKVVQEAYSSNPDAGSQEYVMGHN